MKIAITSTGPSLESIVDPRFGRCQFFLIVDPETMKFVAHENQAGSQRGGAGPLAAKTISDFGVTVLLTGDVGPNAFDALKAAGIKAYIGAKGTVTQAIQQWKNSELKEIGTASIASHSGMR